MKKVPELADFNSKITSLGYSPISQRDFQTIHAASGDDLQAWLSACLARPEGKGPEFHTLRSALFSVSALCQAALLKHELDTPPVALARWLIARGEAGRQMVRLLANRASGKDVDAVVHEIRSALLGGRPTSQPEGIKDRTMKVHGSRFALTVEQTWNVHGQAVVQIEMAKKLTEGRYDWTNKLSLQLSEHETVGVLDVLIGRSDQFEVSNHGRDMNKSFRIEAQKQAGGIYINARQGADSRGVLMPVFQSFRFIALASKAVAINNPGLSTDEILTITKIVGARFAAA